MTPGRVPGHSKGSRRTEATGEIGPPHRRHERQHRHRPATAGAQRQSTISTVTADIWASHLERFASPGPDGLVFPNAAGNPIAAASFWNNHFSRAQRASGVSCRFHDLRHSSVALAIAEGAHLKAIHARMGHSSINVTLNRYGHLFPELDEAIATSFGERLADALADRYSNVLHARFGGQ